MTVSATAMATILAGHSIAVRTVWFAGRQGMGVPVRAICTAPDRVITVEAARFLSNSTTVDVGLADMKPGDLITPSEWNAAPTCACASSIAAGV